MHTLEAQEYLRSQFHEHLTLVDGWILKAIYQEEIGYWNGQKFDYDVDNSEFFRSLSEANNLALQLKMRLPDLDIVVNPALLSE